MTSRAASAFSSRIAARSSGQSILVLINEPSIENLAIGLEENFKYASSNLWAALSRSRTRPAEVSSISPQREYCKPAVWRLANALTTAVLSAATVSMTIGPEIEAVKKPSEFQSCKIKTLP
jgi:hypothetical protein